MSVLYKHVQSQGAQVFTTLIHSYSDSLLKDINCIWA